jgi:hypothetical protein
MTEISLKKFREKRTYLETIIHKSCVRYFDNQYPKYRLNFIKIDNEGKRSKAAGGIAKACGLRKGAADMFLSISNKEYHGLFVEFKSDMGFLRMEQEYFADAVEKTKYCYVVIRDLDDFIKFIDNWMKNNI